MKLKKQLIMGGLFMLALTSCGAIKNSEYEEFSTKMHKIINDFVGNDNQNANRNVKNVRRSFNNKDEVTNILDSSDLYTENKIDIRNAFEQSLYIPVLVGQGLTKYRKQSTFYNLISLYEENGYVRVTKEGNDTTTFVYIPEEIGYDNDAHYLYFDVIYNSENDYVFTGFEKSNTENTEWYFYGDNTLMYLEYSKTSEGAEVRYQDTQLNNKVYTDETLVSDIRTKFATNFTQINKDEFKSLKTNSQFVITKAEADEIIKDLFPESVAVNAKGIVAHNGIASMYIADGESRVVIPSDIKYLENDFRIITEGNTKVKELFIPKSVIGVKDYDGNDVDVSKLKIIYENGNNSDRYLEKIEVEQGSTLLKTTGPLLTDYSEHALLYVMNQQVDSLDLARYSSYPERLEEVFAQKTILGAKSLKVNAGDPNSGDTDILSYFMENNASYNYHYDYLEICNVTNDTLLYFSGESSIKKLVVRGNFDYARISDSNKIVSEVELDSTNKNACLDGDLNGLKILNIYGDEFNNIRCASIEKIIVHEGVTSFNLANIEFDYSENRNIEVYLPSTLQEIQYRTDERNIHIKIITKVNDILFNEVSNMKMFGYEVEIEDNAEINKIFNDYEFVAYSPKESGTIALMNYCGSESELYVPETILGKTVTSFTIDDVSSLNHKVFDNVATLKKIHLPGTINLFSVYTTDSDKLYRLEELYFDGAYEDFSNACLRSPSALLEIEFCKKIICNDKTLSQNVTKDNCAYKDKHLEDAIISLDCTNVVVNKSGDIYILDMNINGEKISTNLTLAVGNEYTGVILYNGVKLSVQFVTNGELVVTHYIESEDTTSLFEFVLKENN